MDIKGNFDVGYYLEKLYRDPTDKERGLQPFRLRCIYEFYKKFCTGLSSVRLLEYGGGPVIYPLISACPYVDEITFSDFQQASLDAVSMWKNGSEGSHDWFPYFKYVVSEIEGNDNKEAVLQRQMELRKKLKYFTIGDILAENILASDTVSPAPEGMPKQFDIVSCNLCLEVPAKTIYDYKRNVNTLSKLVKPGGYVISLVTLENSYYCFSNGGKEKSFLLYIQENDVREAYEEAGFVIVHSEVFVLEEKAQHIGIDGSKSNMFIVGQKVHI